MATRVGQIIGLFLLLPAGAVVVFLVSWVFQHRYNDSGFGYYRGVVYGKFFTNNFFIGFQGRTQPPSRMLMTDNPYKSPPDFISSPVLPQNNLGRTGFVLSLTGVFGLFLAGPFGALISTVAMYVAFLSLPGLVISAVGLGRQPRRLAAWGVALGIFGSLYLPTFFLSLFVFPYR